jgi:vitamin B12 transporter
VAFLQAIMINNAKIFDYRNIDAGIFFKHWSRKKYAVLNSLKKIIKICVLLTTYSILARFEIIASHADTIRINKKIDLDEIEVIGQRSPALYSEVSRIVTVITKEEIKRAPVQSIQDLLEYITGVDIRQRGMFGVQADLNIRGSSFDQVLILLNGINISDPHTGHFNLNLPLDAESIERVEILNGPAARVLGANAFAGAINIVTATMSENNVYLSASAGENGFSKLSTSATLHTKTSSNYMSLSRTGSNGYIEYTGFERYNIFYQGGLDAENASFSYQAGYDYKDFGANSFYSSKYPEQYEKIKTTFVSVKAATGDKINISPLIYWRRLNDHYSMVMDTLGTFNACNLTDIFGANMNVVARTKLGKTAVGFEYRTENIFSNNRGLEMSVPVKLPGEKDILLDKSYIRSNLGFFIEQDVYLGKFCFSGGLMINWNSTFRNRLRLYPGVDISYSILNDLKVYGSVNSTLRLPSFTDMFYESPDTYGNINLKPEKATSAEGGLKLALPEISGQLSYYHRIGKDIIDWVLGTDTVWHAENIANITVNGIDISFLLHLNNILSDDFFLEELNLSYSHASIRKSTHHFESKYALDNLRHKFTATTSVSINKNTGAGIYLIYQDRSGNYDVYNPKTGDYDLVPYKSFWLFNTKLYWEKGKLYFFLEANNLFNTTYRDISNVVQPGRWVIGGVKLNIDLLKKN